MPQTTLDVLVADLELLSADPEMPAARLGALPRLHIVEKQRAHQMGRFRDASPQQQAIAAAESTRAVLVEALARLGRSREGRALHILFGFPDPVASPDIDVPEGIRERSDITTREELAAQILEDSVRTVQRNRHSLLRLAAEQLLYMELELLNAHVAEDDGFALDVGWDGFQTDSWAMLWRMEKDPGGDWVHRIERRVALTSGGLGTMVLPFGAYWTGSGALETMPIEDSSVASPDTDAARPHACGDAEYIGRYSGIPHRWSPKPYPWDLFFFGRNTPRGESVFVAYACTGFDPERTFEPFAAYRPRNRGVRLSWRVELPNSLPPDKARLRITAGLPPHTHDIKTMTIEASSPGIYQVNTTVELDPKREEDLRYQLEFDKTSFADLY